MKTTTPVARYVQEIMQAGRPAPGGQAYIKPSSLAKGCLLYVAFELRSEPKPPMEARIDRILSVGTDSHRRLQRALSRACLGQEVFFQDQEYRIQGFCDGILYVKPDGEQDPEMAGFWALEFKTTAASEFDMIKAAGIPKAEHVRQAQIYLWGLERHFHGAVPLKGAIIYYENRDTLEHLALEVYPDAQYMEELLGQIKSLLADVDADRLPEDTLPPDHWAHRYCPYLEICEPGQKAMQWQAQQPKSLPDKVVAGIIADRIVAKKSAEKMTGKAKSGTRSLSDLAQDLDWD